MKPTNSKSIALWVIGLMALFMIFGCEEGGGDDTAVSTLSRPVAIAIAIIEWDNTVADEAISESFEGLWEQCIGLPERPYAFIANSAGDSVARIDLCTQEIRSSNLKGNPWVFSHIPVGEFPSDVAVSLDQYNSRVFVANSGENSLSVIITKEARTLENKVELSSRPTHLVVTPSEVNPEGDVFVSTPERHRLVRVVKGKSDARERWVEDGYATLITEETPEPIPGPMVLSPDRRYVYVSDLAYDYFHIVDLANPTYPARIRYVAGPQRDISVSPDGRYLYLAKLDSKFIAVYDLGRDDYVDTNEELPSHWNDPPPTDDYSYDIELTYIPRKAVFAEAWKAFASDDETEDGDIDSAGLADGDAESDTAQDADGDAEASEGEASEGEVELEASDIARRLGKTDEKPTSLYAYSIGLNGHIQVIDVHDNMHEIYDTNPANQPDLTFLSNDDLKIDNDQCLADLNPRLYKKRTPAALWELVYRGTLPGSDNSLSGRFDFENNRFYDDNLDFSTLEELWPRPKNGQPGDPGYKPGDILEILNAPNPPSSDGVGCRETIVDENGETKLVGLDVLELEIIEVTPDYLVYDPRSIDLRLCYDTAVEYLIRANDNYLVYMTGLDSNNSRITARLYQGRALNAPFKKGDMITGEEALEALNFEQGNWNDFVCANEIDNGDGNTVTEFTFKNDLALADSNVSYKGIRCVNPWEDGPDVLPSFANDFISFSVCQDDTSDVIRDKQTDRFVYTFATTSGVNEIREITVEGEITDFSGVLFEDAAFLDFIPNLPRLYVVDSTEEVVYVIDLTRDVVISALF